MKLASQNVNGKEIPVIIHEPVNNGEAANNVGLKDMSPKVGEGEMTMDKFNEMMALYNARVNANQVTLSAQISAREVQKGRERSDKATGAPILIVKAIKLFTLAVTKSHSFLKAVPSFKTFPRQCITSLNSIALTCLKAH